MQQNTLRFTEQGSGERGAFGVAGPNVWNSVPMSIRTISCTVTFKHPMTYFGVSSNTFIYFSCIIDYYVTRPIPGIGLATKCCSTVAVRM